MTDVYKPRLVFAVTAPSISPSELVPIADTTTLVWPLNAMRVPPKPLNESAPLLAVETRVQVLPASVERKIPKPKYESAELLASPVAARITDFVESGIACCWMAIAPIESVA
jgi:hypothetical protein